MQIVEALADSNVLDAAGHHAFNLQQGCQYLLHDREAGLGLHQDAVQVRQSVERHLRIYTGQPLTNERLILPFIGKCGDAIVVSCCLAALRQRNPKTTVRIASPATIRGVFALIPENGEIVPYPLQANDLDQYDYVLSLEDMDGVANGTGRSCGDVFRACLRTPRASALPRIRVPDEVRLRHRLPSTPRQRVALHVARSGSLRSYPPDLTEQLVRLLEERGHEVVLIGCNDAGIAASEIRGDHVCNLVGQTESPADLAAVLEQVDAVVVCDSFPMHLAGVMGIPTLALFTSTDCVLGSDYQSVVAIQSRAECSPCRLSEGTCPKGHPNCVAHHDSSMAPTAIADHVCELLGTGVPSHVK